MNRLKGLAFVVVLSLISAVSLRLLLGRATTAMAPATPSEPVPVTAAEVERRFVGCGSFVFAFDSLGYTSRQWPGEVAGGTSVANATAVFVARSGDIVAVAGDSLGEVLGSYGLDGSRVEVILGPDADLRADLGPLGDSLAGSLALRRNGDTGEPTSAPDSGSLPVVGRVFLATPVPRPAGCDA